MITVRNNLIQKYSHVNFSVFWSYGFPLLSAGRLNFTIHAVKRDINFWSDKKQKKIAVTQQSWKLLEPKIKNWDLYVFLQLNAVIDSFDVSKNMIEKIKMLSLNINRFWCKIIVIEKNKIHLSVYKMPLWKIHLFLIFFLRM